MHISVLLWEKAVFCDVIRWLEVWKLASVRHGYISQMTWIL